MNLAQVKPVEITFREFTQKTSKNYAWTNRKKVIYNQQEIKLGQFMQEGLDSVLRKIKNRKAAGLDEIPPKVWKTRQSDNIPLQHCNDKYNQSTID